MNELDIFVEDAIKEVNNKLSVMSFLKGKENVRKEINILIDEMTIKYGLRPEEKFQVQQEILKTYPELRYL